MKLNMVGKNIIRVDAEAKVTGEALYPQDIYLDNMVYGKTVRSTKPHAYIKVDIREAEKVDGVLKVFTYKDVPNKNEHGVVLKDHEVFASRKAIRVGEPIAFIVAETVRACEEAYRKIRIDYEELPAVFDPIEAMKEDAPKIHGDSNIIYHYKLRRGDIEEGKKKSKYIVENVYKSPMVEHAFLQPEAGLAYVEEDGTVVVVIATQYPHYDREEVAINLGLPEEKVKIINTNVGGAFGAREDITAQIHLALAAMVLKRPVKVIYSREESFLAHSKRHPMIMKYKTGADENGYLQYMEAEIIGDAGAHCSWAMNVLRKAGVHATGPYVIPHVKVDSYAVYTNNPFTGAMRGFGATQVPIAHEQQMDALAEKLGMNPIEFRMKNIFRKGSITATGQVLVDSVPLDRCIEAVDKSFKFSQLWKEGK
ncbi:MAG: molybdopterin-dependent oxidoreductase [Tissierellia bacterium]|nr:molybdopterin-dependent oxidoreductase [Tissierellia bacterium]